MKPLPFEHDGVKTSGAATRSRPRNNNKKSERAKLISRIVAYSDTNNPRDAKTVLKLIEDTRAFILKIDLEKRKVIKNGKTVNQLKMKKIGGHGLNKKRKR
jgi:hypothetical protein